MRVTISERLRSMLLVTSSSCRLQVPTAVGTPDGGRWVGPHCARLERLASPTNAAVLGAIAVAIGAASLIASVIDDKAGGAGPILIPTTMFVAVGVVVARRQPRNPIGWLLIFVALLENMFVFATAYVVLNHWLGHGLGALASAALWFQNSFWDLGLIVGLPSLLLFPNGGVPSGRWRTTLHIYVVAAVLVVASQCVTATILLRWHNLQLDANGNPIGSPSTSGFVAFGGSTRLRDAVDLETVRLDLLAVVSHAVEPAHAAVWISPAPATRAGSP